jgi:hypothetical protein
MSEPSASTFPAELIEAVAQRVADLLAPRLVAALAQPSPHEPTQWPTRRLLSLDELVAQLPAAKRPATWKRWLYEHSRHGHVPGCHKLGGRLYYDPEQTIPWLLQIGKTTGSSSQSEQQSTAMPTATTSHPARTG